MLQRFFREALVLAPTGALIGLIVTAMLLWRMPEAAATKRSPEPSADAPAPAPANMHESQVVLQITANRPPLDLMGSGQPVAVALAAETEAIQSDPVLGAVSRQLDLPGRWGIDAEAALHKLRQAVTAEGVRGTDLITITIRLPQADTRDARDIAGEVAAAYIQARAQQQERMAERQLRELNKAVREQEDRVEERRKVLSTIVRTKGIIYKGQDPAHDAAGMDEHVGDRNALHMHHQLEQEKLQLESQIKSLLKYHNEQLMIYACGLDLPDNIVRTLYPKYLELKRKLEAMDDEDRNRQAAQETLKRMEADLNEGVAALRNTLQAQLELAKARLQKVTAMKELSREQAIKRALDAQDYVDAKREYETDQQLLQTLKLKQIGETISRKIPGEGVRILRGPSAATQVPETALTAADATPSTSPAPPPVTPGMRALTLLDGSIYGLAAGLLLALPAAMMRK